MSVTPVGYIDDAGFAYSGGYGELIDALLEYIPDLLWPLSIRTFAQMRVEPQIGGVLKAYTLPIRRASWALDGTDCRPEVTQLIADELGLPIMGVDKGQTGARRRRVTWGEHLRLSLIDLSFGHMPFERTYEYDGRYQRLALLQERMPQTISQIRVGANGELDSIVQNALSGQPADAAPPKIEAKSLVWYANDKEGSNWTGRSLLRASYAPWLIKHELWRVHATSIRRFGMGVPSVEAPPGATPVQVAEAQRLASAMRGGDQAGAGLPPGFRLALTGITGSVPDALAFIKYLDGQITHNTLTGLLDLGSTETGSRALGDTFLDLFMMALQSIAEEHAEQATKQLVVPLVNINWSEDEPAPRIVVGDLGADREVTAATLQALLASGALEADPELRAHVRKLYRLPAVAQIDLSATPEKPSPADLKLLFDALGAAVRSGVVPEDAAKLVGLDGLTFIPGFVPITLAPERTDVPAPAEPPVVPPTTPALASDPRSRDHPVVAGAGATFHRQPTAIEAASRADFNGIQASWEDATGKLTASWASVSKDQKAEVLTQVKAAVKAGDYAALGAMSVGVGAAAALIFKTMNDVAKTASGQAQKEIEDQGQSMTGEPEIDNDRLEGIATALAGVLSAGYTAFAARTALQNWSPDATESTVAAAVETALDGLGDASLSDTLGAALSTAQNEGRAATFAAATEATYYASEIMDSATCGECSAIDGHQYDNLAEASADYASGGYVGCDGGMRCRGILVAVFGDATTTEEDS